MTKPSSNPGKFVSIQGDLPGKCGIRIDTPKESRKAETKLMAQSHKATVPK